MENIRIVWGDNSVSPREVIGTIWSRRVAIGLFVGLMTLGAVVVSLIMPIKYGATASFYHIQDTQQTSAGIAGLASTFGLNLNGQSQASIAVEDILVSPTFLDTVLTQKWTNAQGQPQTILDLWEIDEDTNPVIRKNARDQLRTRFRQSRDKVTGLYRVRVSLEDPDLAASLANFSVHYIQNILDSRQAFRDSLDQLFVNARIQEAYSELQKANRTLEEFLVNNLSYQQSPALLSKFTSLNRDRTLREQTYLNLYVELERISIEKKRDVRFVEVLDWALPPAQRYSPKRAKIVVTTFVFSLFLALVFLYLWRTFVVTVNDGSTPKEHS